MNKEIEEIIDSANIIRSNSFIVREYLDDGIFIVCAKCEKEFANDDGLKCCDKCGHIND
jgi:hypothetical protein